MIATITAIGSLAGLIVSLCLLTWQTRAVARQTGISNGIAGSTALIENSASMREIFMLFIDRPELRPYFYDGKALPHRTSQRYRVLSIAEMFSDTLEAGLLVTRLTPAAESYEDWFSYCHDMLKSSPALVFMVHSHPAWWPHLFRLLNSSTSTT
jgi:hypothetical protein